MPQSSIRNSACLPSKRLEKLLKFSFLRFAYRRPKNRSESIVQRIKRVLTL